MAVSVAAPRPVHAADHAQQTGTTSATVTPVPDPLKDFPGTIDTPRRSPDGTSIAFASDLGGNWDIWLAREDGAAPTRITRSEADDRRPTWSPSGDRLIFDSNRAGSWDLWSLEIGGGPPVQLTDAPGVESAPDWSPRGDRVTYFADTAGSWDIWVMAPDGSEARAVTTNPGNEWHPKFAPDGERIVFYSTWSGWTDIWTLDLGSGEERELAAGVETEDYRPEWSPDGQWIAFVSDRGGSSQIWAVPAAGGDPVQLSELDGGPDYLDWSSDEDLLFNLTHSQSVLYRLDLVSGQSTRISSAGDAFDEYPDVAADGRIAFVSSRDGNEENVFWTPESGVTTRVTNGRILDSFPRYSPDGSRLIFASGGGDFQSWDLYEASVADRSVRRLTRSGSVRHPAYCGPGAIAYLWSEASATTTQEVWILEADQTTRFGSVEVLGTGLDCSRDGRWLFATQASDAGDRIVRIDRVDGSVLSLLPPTVQGGHPRLSPDGNTIAFSMILPDASYGVATVDVGGGEPTVHASPAGEVTSVAWSADGREILFTLVSGTRRAANLRVQVGNLPL